MQTAHKHHFIPAFYLRKWVDGSGKVLEFSRPYRRVLANGKYPTATGYRRDLYSVDLGNSKANDIFETGYLARVDDSAAKIVQSIIAGTGFRQPGETTQFSRFLVTLMQRDPSMIAILTKRIKEDYEWVISALRSRFSHIFDDNAAFDAFITRTMPNGTGEALLHTYRTLMDNVALGQRFNDLEWFARDFKGCSHKLLTSDHPLTIFSSRTAINSMVALLPISPTTGVFGFADRRYGARLLSQAPDDLVRNINIAVVQHAVDYVWASDDTQLRFIENRFGSARHSSYQAQLREAVSKRTFSSKLRRDDDFIAEYVGPALMEELRQLEDRQTGQQGLQTPPD